MAVLKQMIMKTLTNKEIRYKGHFKFNGYLRVVPNQRQLCHTFEDGEGVITFAREITGICACSFNFDDNITEIALPDSVRTIGHHVFLSSDGIRRFTVGRNVKRIGNGVLSNCKNLKRIKVDKDNPCFNSKNGCNAIIDSRTDTLISTCRSTNYIPDNVRGIAIDAFGCYRSSTITVDEHNPVYDSREGCNAIIRTATDTLEIGFAGSVIPGSVRHIGSDAFALSRIKSLTIPGSIISVGERAFLYSRIEKVSIEVGVSIIGEEAFAGCINLKDIVIPDSVTEIGVNAFKKLYITHGKKDD